MVLTQIKHKEVRTVQVELRNITKHSNEGIVTWKICFLRVKGALTVPALTLPDRHAFQALLHSYSPVKRLNMPTDYVRQRVDDKISKITSKFVRQ